ncbi:MAG: leucine-rich repeat protein [Streptococcaceae bacterium]|jgi:IgA-specific serine endopeptidase|nr:leucine-rich repeat protein [Streptococcaceae bacterium]
MRKKIVVAVAVGTVMAGAGQVVGLPNVVAQAAVVTSAYTDAQGMSYTIDTTKKTAFVASYSGAAGADIVIPDTIVVSGVTYSVTEIGASAFLNAGIHSVVIGANVVNIGTSAFQTTTAATNYYKKALVSVVLGPNVATIKTDAFAGNALTELVLPESVVTIGTRAFANNLLTALEMPASVTTVSDKAFQSNVLTSVKFDKASKATIGSMAFSGSPVTDLTLGEGVVWASDALNKVSVLASALDDMPATGVRHAFVKSDGTIVKSWTTGMTQDAGEGQVNGGAGGGGKSEADGAAVAQEIAENGTLESGEGGKGTEETLLEQQGTEKSAGASDDLSVLEQKELTDEALNADVTGAKAEQEPKEEPQVQQGAEKNGDGAALGEDADVADLVDGLSNLTTEENRPDEALSGLPKELPTEEELSEGARELEMKDNESVADSVISENAVDEALGGETKIEEENAANDTEQVLDEDAELSTGETADAKESIEDAGVAGTDELPSVDGDVLDTTAAAMKDGVNEGTLLAEEVADDAVYSPGREVSKLSVAAKKTKIQNRGASANLPLQLALGDAVSYNDLPDTGDAENQWAYLSGIALMCFSFSLLSKRKKVRESAL